MTGFDKLIITLFMVGAGYMAFNTNTYSEQRYKNCMLGGYSWTTCQMQAFQ